MKPGKIHTTNYIDTFIEVADDCSAKQSEIPPLGDKSKSIARLQFELLRDAPYTFTSDDVIFGAFALKNGLEESEKEAARKEYFAKGQPCFRASPLTKRYGWGIHSNSEGKIAMYALESIEYKHFVDDTSVSKVKAMKSKR